MKHGATADLPEQTSKRRKHNGSLPIDSLPHESFAHVMSFLPAYSFKGTNSIQQVCKKWYEDIPVTQKTIQEIIESCRDPEDALAILKDQMLHDQMGYDWFFYVVGTHTELALHLLNNQHLKPADLLILGQRNELIAQRILNSPELQHQMMDLKFVKMGAFHISTAQYILNNLQLGGFELAWLGRHHVPIAQQILNSRRLCRFLEGADLNLMGCAHLPIAQQILNQRHLCAKLGTHQLIELGEAHLPIAQTIIKNGALREQLQVEGLVCLGETHLEIAQHLFTNQNQYSVMVQHLTRLGRAHVAIAQQIFENSALRAQLKETDWVSLCQAHLEIAQRVYEDQAHRKLLDKLFLKLDTPFNIASRILDDVSLLAKLDKSIAWFSIKQFEIARYILNDQQLRANLSRFDVVKLVQIHLAHDLMNMKECDRMEIANVNWFQVKANVRVLQQLISDPDLNAMLDKVMLRYLGITYVSFANSILESPTLCNKLSEEDLAQMKGRLSIVDTVKEYVDYLTTNSQPQPQAMDNPLNSKRLK